MKIPDEYDIKARALPAFLSIMPILLFSHFYLYSKLPKFLDSLFKMKLFGDISAAIIFTYLFMQICRFVSKKFYQDTYFNKDELNMPTTDYLMWSNDRYSREYKRKIHDKIKKAFGIALLASEEEAKDELEARKRIVEAVGHVRNQVKRGYLLHQHNIEYGFMRNLIGGSTVALALSFFTIPFFYAYEKNITALVLSIALFIL